MKWREDGPCAFTRDDGAYTVTRAPQEGWPGTYALIDRRTGVIVYVARNVSEAERAEVMRSLMEMCE